MPIQTELIKPKYRFLLKGKIHTKGFRTLREFGEFTDTDYSSLSRIINGWEIPSPNIQKRIARALGITTTDLHELLL